MVDVEVPFYKAVAITDLARAMALLYPADEQGRGPQGLQVWRLKYGEK